MTESYIGKIDLNIKCKLFIMKEIRGRYDYIDKFRIEEMELEIM